MIGRRRGGRLFEAGRLLTFSAFRMGAYSRWALIRGWAVIRINTVYINLNFTRLRFEFDITWLNVCVLKPLNFWLLIFLLFCLEKRINVPKKPKNNENERAGKAVYSCSNFLSISNLLINLNFVRARFEFNIKWLNVCDLKTLNFRFSVVFWLHDFA